MAEKRWRQVSTPVDNRRVDLHMHSNHSDGKLSPEEIVSLAIQRKLDIIALPITIWHHLFLHIGIYTR